LIADFLGCGLKNGAKFAGKKGRFRKKPQRGRNNNNGRKERAPISGLKDPSEKMLESTRTVKPTQGNSGKGKKPPFPKNLGDGVNSGKIAEKINRPAYVSGREKKKDSRKYCEPGGQRQSGVDRKIRGHSGASSGKRSQGRGEKNGGNMRLWRKTGSSPVGNWPRGRGAWGRKGPGREENTPRG